MFSSFVGIEVVMVACLQSSCEIEVVMVVCLYSSCGIEVVIVACLALVELKRLWSHA